jgi:hypothetical protein
MLDPDNRSLFFKLRAQYHWYDNSDIKKAGMFQNNLYEFRKIG